MLVKFDLGKKCNSQIIEDKTKRKPDASPAEQRGESIEVSASARAMAADALETPSPTSQSPSYYSQLRHFYLAVDRLGFKMETLVDLLRMAGRRPCLPMVVCCSTRDELDAVCSAVSNVSYISVASLYSDLAEAERLSVLEKFRQATAGWNQISTHQSGDDSEMGKEEQKSYLIVVTDTCLPLVASGESPIAARVLINYELPTKKEIYTRRMATCLASDGIVINMVVGGEVVTLKSLEESSSLVIAEMPIDIFELF
ncbi:RNA helicase [Bertholletia excelsa]